MKTINRIEILVYPFFDRIYNVHIKEKIPKWLSSAKRLAEDGMMVVVDDSWQGNFVGPKWEHREIAEKFFHELKNYLVDRIVAVDNRHNVMDLEVNYRMREDETIKQAVEKIGSLSPDIEIEAYGQHLEPELIDGEQRGACVETESYSITQALGFDKPHVSFNRSKSVLSLFSALRILLKEHHEEYEELEKRARKYAWEASRQVSKYPGANRKLRLLEDYLYSGEPLLHLRHLSKANPSLDGVLDALGYEK
ncbi:TPA: hypothetical protein HA239_03450 [Candidatus Woesearchaeota archaeon]|nr:hypothetical protein QT06_C0001G0024 [archaeon GW2011_AR15]MBS3104165.1 hypothetical protein [Candidatus Woesearchaeota archaeon]HIH41445.1 hypothetical protein [Candidatus Woesearchaeota archaeon]